MPRKTTYPQWFIDELLNEDDKERARNGSLLSKDKVKFICENGHEYEQTINLHIRNGERLYGCNICSRKNNVKYLDEQRRILKEQRTYPKWFIDELVNEEDKLRANNGSLTSKEKVKFKCENGHEYEMNVGHKIVISTGYRKSGCPLCNFYRREKFERNYPQWFIEELVEESDKEKARSGKLSPDSTVCVKCKDGHITERKVNNIIKISSGERLGYCKVCHEEKLKNRRLYPEEIVEMIASENDRERAISRELKTNEIIEFRCNKGHIFKRRVSDVINFKTNEVNTGCPLCNVSKGEEEIAEYLKSIYDGTILRNVRDIIAPKELDIFLPEKNIAIEYNGSFFHKNLPDDGHTKEKMYHQNKYLACREKGIRLISIFDVDWSKRKEKIENYLKNILQPHERIYARKCVVREISFVEANMLYENYHLLERLSMSNVNYGLFFNNELVSCMSFQENRYKEGWCLCRFVTKGNITIVGGAEKLLKQFIREYNPEKIISFSDNDYFTGNVYDKLGFECLGCNSSPRYYWYLNGEENKREHCQLKRLKIRYPDLYNESYNQTEIKNKETYIMLNVGAYKVYRSGHTKWLWKKTE